MKKRLLVLGTFLLGAPMAFAQIAITNLNLRALHADVSAIDYDGDGDLDILVSGEDGGARNIGLYLNDGAGGFTPAGTDPITATTRASFGWGDVNRDGKLDLVTSGFKNDPIDTVYTSDGHGVFRANTGIALPQITPGCGFADLNNDGYTDIYVFGNKFQGKSKLMINDQAGAFLISSPFDSKDWIDTDVTPVDFDNDGDIDLFVTAGDESGTRYSRMWVNRRGTFTERDLGIIPKGPGSSAWMDVNGDGWLDLLLGGDGWQGTAENSNEVYRIYRNNSGLSFTELTTFSPYRQNSTGDGCRMMDWDKDGDVDAVVTGWNPGAGTQKTAIFLNNGTGTSWTLWAQSDALPGISEGSIELADLDADTDLDLILTGFSGNDYNGPGSAYNDKISVVVTNPISGTNTAPSVPSNLVASFQADSTVFTWNASTDGNTPSASISYNFFLVSESGQWYYWPLADTASGRLKLATLGNTYLSRRWVVRGLPQGRYRWGVQAVDNGFVPSAFAKSTLVGVIPAPPLTVTNLNLRAMHADVSAVDYDMDGDLDILVSGEDGGTRNIGLYLNDGAGNLSPASSAPLTAVTRTSFSWDDINGDGKLDLLLSGFKADPIDSVYTSDGHGAYTRTNIALPQITPSSGFADLNNDGYTDIYVFGNKFQGKSKLYINDRNGGFTVSSPFDGLDLVDPDATAVDYDNDGDIDLFLTAGDNFGTRYARMWVNHRGSFTERSLGIIPKGPGSSSWMDVDGDGWLDLLLNGDGWQGTAENSNEVYRLYRNQAGVFTEMAIFTPYRQNSTGDGSRLVDWNNDGRVDVIATGWNPNISQQKTVVFLNQGGGAFAAWTRNDAIPGVSEGSIEVADMDNDSDLDLILTGFSGNDYNGAGTAFNDKVTLVVKNPTAVVNAAPAAPSGLQALFSPDSVVFRWNAAVDATTPQASLSYNLFLVDQQGRWFYYPLADTATGSTKLPRLGNVQLNRRWVVYGLPQGRYRWGVQTVDNGFRTSAFTKATLNAVYTLYSRSSGNITSDASGSSLWSLSPAGTGYPLGNPAVGSLNENSRVVIQGGHTVSYAAAGVPFKSVTVSAGGTLTTPVGGPYDLNLYEGITNVGTVSGHLGINLMGDAVLLSGDAPLNVEAIRKTSPNPAVTVLTLRGSVNLTGSGVSLYNLSQAVLNVTVAAGAQVTAAADGGVSLDGLDGTWVGESGGTLTVLGSLDAGHVLYARNNNATAATSVSLGAAGTLNVDSALLDLSAGTGTGFTIVSGGRFRVRRHLELASGNLPAGLELLSVGGRTASLGRLSGAQTVGAIVMERQLPAYAGWHFIGAPVKGKTLADWAGLGGRILPKNNANLFGFTEGDTTRGVYNGQITEVNGWKVVPTLAQNINPGDAPTGYRYYGAAQRSIRIAGQPFTGTVSRGLTYSPASGWNGGGWNLIANPYPSDIDWDAVAASNPQAVLGRTYYIWSNGSYATYTAGIGGTNGAQASIASSQGFFVKVTAPTSISFAEAHKVSGSTAYLRAGMSEDVLRMTLQDSLGSDEALIAFRDQASRGADPMDADKLDGSHLNISSLANGRRLAVNTLPLPTLETIVPLHTAGMSAGLYQLRFSGLEGFASGTEFFLRDRLLNALHDLTASSSYAFTASGLADTDRFELVLRPALVTALGQPMAGRLMLYPNPASAQARLVATGLSVGPAQVHVYATDGRLLLQEASTISERGVLEMSLPGNLPKGLYIIRLTTTGQVLTDRLILE